ncbi:hypothetical protein [uncultured Treponema sp.]|uniref:hypothetical protein n=1 Tax=uncultured Treponema sp. TaxID=162155 RepID=UPI00259324A7|nr:hypothetical protein [uncultured Treponema sp.]
MKKSLWTDKLFRKDFMRIWKRLKSGTRYSMKREPNTAERLAFIMEKYKDGLPDGEVENLINSL